METTLRSYPPGIRGSVAPMTPGTAEVVICGAGIAGIATAYHLTRQGVTDIVLVDERPPLSLTSDKSTECYRNVWPGPGDAMVAAMNRSIDLLEELARESGNVFRMNRRGYLFASADPGRIPRFIRSAQEAADLGAGAARVHASAASDYRPSPADGFEDQPVGVDVITDRTLIRRHFPYLADDTVALFHGRRARRDAARGAPADLDGSGARGLDRGGARGAGRQPPRPARGDSDRRPRPARGRRRQPDRAAAVDVPSRPGRARVSADVRSRLRRAGHSRHGAHGAGLRALRRSAAARGGGRRLLHEDAREPIPGRAAAGGGRLRVRRARRLRVDGVQRGPRAGRRARDGAAAAAVRAGVRARALRRSRVSRAARALGRFRAAVVRAVGRRGAGAPPSEASL